MGLRLLLVTSLSLNLVLAGLAFLTPASRSSLPDKPEARVEPEGRNIPKDRRTQRRVFEGPTSPSRSIWRSLYDDDLRVYISNLRRTGCPELVIQQIIASEVKRQFDGRWQSRVFHTNYWMTGQQRDAWRRQKSELERELVLEERAVLKDLLGVGWYESERARLDEERTAWTKMFFGFLPPVKEEKLGDLLTKHLDRRQNIKGMADEWLRPEISEQRERMRADLIADLSAVVSPEELEEIELRVLTVSVLDVWNVPEQFGSELSGAEFRELLRIKKGGDHPLQDFFFDDRESAPLDPQEEKNRLAQVRALLGDERFQGYVRAQDFSFRWDARAVRALDLPMPVTWSLYDIRTGALQQGRALNTHPQLTPAQRSQDLETLKRQTIDQLRSALGSELLPRYLSDNKWTEELDKLKP